MRDSVRPKGTECCFRGLEHPRVRRDLSWFRCPALIKWYRSHAFVPRVADFWLGAETKSGHACRGNLKLHMSIAVFLFQQHLQTDKTPTSLHPPQNTSKQGAASAPHGLGGVEAMAERVDRYG